MLPVTASKHGRTRFWAVRDGDGDPWPLEKTWFMAADRQARGGEHHFWVCRAFGPGGASRLVGYGRCNTTSELEETRKASESSCFRTKVLAEYGHPLWLEPKRPTNNLCDLRIPGSACRAPSLDKSLRDSSVLLQYRVKRVERDRR